MTLTVVAVGSHGWDRRSVSAEASTTAHSSQKVGSPADASSTTTTGEAIPTVSTSLLPRPPGLPITELPTTQPGTVPVLTHIHTTDPVVFVTIDDGTVRSPATAEALHGLGVPVTLFLVDHPIHVGHSYFSSLPDATIESHTRSHPDLRTLPETDQRAEICGNVETIGVSFGRRPTLFRPPYGNFNDDTRRAAAACGVKAIVLWNVVVDRGSVSFRTSPPIRPGDIILLHFTDDLPSDLRVVSERIAAAGLTVGSLEDYLGV